MNLIEKIKSAGLFRPKALTLAITTDCNLHCGHCLVLGPQHQASKEYVPVAKVRQLICEFTQLGGEEVCLTGGDPMTHPDWLEILTFCCRQPGLQSVRLQTNGTLINEQVARQLGTNEFKKLSFQISLDGGTAQSHDLVRGEGSFQRALEGLRCLKNAGCGERTSISFTEMQHNMEDIPELLELASQLGIGSVVGSTLIRGGRASDSKRLTPPTPEQYTTLLDRYDKDSRFRTLYQKYGRFSAIEWMKGRSRPSSGGCRLLERPYVTVSGLIFPCALLQDDSYAGVGIYERSLAEVIESTITLWRELLEASRRRAKEMKCVETCPGMGHCAGGCFARSVVGKDSTDTREDRCSLRRAVYTWGKK